ncbi:hypothetical protein HNQ94_000021 [Salirhabdus euzebyi]|uniref:Uncharacterized protein n=1 Tax=Salirhabdus euzebyi TaxID=394506 RepID=A0A841PS28_9BACI|nr:hypothetical protein [Salirhabdus euzebyi]MBB6451600.1 hypothetical protein [Salirhabdus euzebyi]
MPILPEAIIEALSELGGERNVREVKEWIYDRYGDRWKDIGTRMSDMVPVSHEGNASSQIQAKYRVLNRVSKGRYCLILNESKIENVKISKIKSNNEKDIVHSKSKSHYYIDTSTNMLEVYTSKRLPFEPKGWQVDMRNSIRNGLKSLNGENVTLRALYKSMSEDFFDVENVLFYNVGSSAFSHLDIKSLQFERVFEYPPTVNRLQQLNHYQSYKILEQNESLSEYWAKKNTLATWKNVTIPKLSSEIKPHSIWYAMKTGAIKVFDRTYSNYYGMEVTIKSPIHTKINLVSVMKPLLDGIISSFHHHELSDLDEVIFRLNHYINLPQEKIERFLLDNRTSILGPRNLIQAYRSGVKWNPKDDAFPFMKINIETQSQNDNWLIDGKIFKISNINS